ncbi:MAG TPA: NAD-dependent epimerase/dehydratase family protein [Tepidisphaeraceae bacterium]|nr:NAD-dependent epimerase/dehydratase family protein [Tepidisphaeraceae bacterium]
MSKRSNNRRSTRSTPRSRASGRNGKLMGESRHQNPVIGALEWFRPGQHDRVDRLLDDMRSLGITELRTGISWADCCTPEGEAWYAWLFPQLARRVNVLPCFVDTPPFWGVAPKTSAPPGDLKLYADFLDVLITRYGKFFEWIELWNEPNDPRKWDAELDPYWIKFSEMIGNAAYWAEHRGKKTVLGGMRPIDPSWLRLMGERNLLKHIDAVGVHAFPGTSESQWEGWTPPVQRVKEVLAEFNDKAQVWITETGYSTWRHDERRQLSAFVDALDAPVDRVYWYSLHDLDPRLPTGDGFHSDERDYHFGLKRADGAEKLLYRLWSEGGLEAVRDAYWLGRGVHGNGKTRPVLITGGAGFIGTNVADRFCSSRQPVLLFDNLSRPGVERNLKWLRQIHGDLIRVEAADVQDPHVLRSAVERASQVFHFAAQVAVTTSLTNAIHDFEVNARGTLNLLEAIRAQDTPPPLIFTSTNKVYGGLPDVKLRVADNRYEPEDEHLRACGISEQRPLDFHSPYGCSKGTADQYVLDYARTFGLPAVVFRMSCIYGPHQFGTEDQGWVAHFLIRALKGEPITLYGDGMQVRDILFIDDLVDAFLLAQAHISDADVGGQAFNIGGSPANTISLIDLLDMIEQLHGVHPEIRTGAWRPGDQRYYVSDTSKISAAMGWSPKIDVREGVARLDAWLQDNSPIKRRAAARLSSPKPGHTPGRRVWIDDAKTSDAEPAPTTPRPSKNGSPSLSPRAEAKGEDKPRKEVL